MEPAPEQEALRIAAVRRYDVLDTPPDGAFDRIAALAARLFDAPAATVAIVDTDRVWFKAAYGLTGVTQVGRDPGLCTSAILTDGPLVIPDTLQDPLARTHELVTGPTRARFYAAAPIVTHDGHRLGTVDVLDTVPRRITSEQADALADLAALVMDALELRLSALRMLRVERELMVAEHAARERAERDRSEIAAYASTLQRTLLPPALPEVPGLEAACHYTTASVHDVGGDFYDVFPLSAGRWAFFLGDVSGRGAPAAALTSLIRYTLRTTALLEPDPCAVLRVLNSTLLSAHADGSRFCTLVFGTLAPDSAGGFAVTLAGGGHLPAYSLYPARRNGPDRAVARAEPVSLPGGMLVGALHQADFASRTVQLLPGEALFLYSDGIIEALTSRGARFGEAGLAAHLTHHAATNRALGASAIIDDLTGLLATFPTGPADDVALLALSASSTTPARAPSGASGTAHTSVPLPAKVWDPCAGPPDEGVRRSAGTKAPES
ncbi:GAF domain-containing SpoIIE family protein phosphatase [Streptomyces sp. NPDC041068]|uniref:PP2C family protein-serine/threonine phosphatase n=1 Tax=Streptomyces sp. NPDC041068 TaxID=3155130 RepID=UPI0034009A03